MYLKLLRNKLLINFIDRKSFLNSHFRRKIFEHRREIFRYLMDFQVEKKVWGCIESLENQCLLRWRSECLRRNFLTDFTLASKLLLCRIPLSEYMQIWDEIDIKMISISFRFSFFDTQISNLDMQKNSSLV